jgi:CRISPR-associated protein Cas1
MPTLYVTEPGTQVRKVDERLVVTRGEEVLDDIPLIKIERVVMVGRGVSLTTAAMYALARHGVDVVYLTGSGRFMTRTAAGEHKHSRLRHQQALRVADGDFSLFMAKSIVLGKVLNQRTLVRRHAESADWSRRALTGMETMAHQIEAARTLDEVRGMEGQAAKEYFGLLRQMLRPPADGQSWGFERRDYYPPPDPVNALLSFGYTLLLNDMVTACQMIGLDPYLGCFHAIDYGRPSMALDLIEEFRPIIIDSLVLEGLNRGFFRLRDFVIATPEEDEENQPAGRKSAGAIHLQDDGRRRFLNMYEERVNEQILYPLTQERTPYRRILSLQAQQVARIILGEVTRYASFTVR